MSDYPFKKIEAKWQKKWESDGIYHAKDGKKEKFYGLIEFPYPSGEGLHVGHPRSYTAIDIVTRKKRMEGKNVLYPIGWDAFGLPTENYAIQHKVKPQDATRKNIATFRRQLTSLGFGFDWSREINTTDPAYYKWTQWMFLKFFTSTFDEKTQRAVPVPVGADPSLSRAAPRDVRPGDAIRPGQVDGAGRLAYKARTTINWCPSCKIGLANEEAVGGVCERCGNPVEKREKEQWMIRITKYAERLLSDLDKVDYLEKIKIQQINWIGKSEGAYIDFNIREPGTGNREPSISVRVFTTRPDTLFGATYLVLAPEHELVQRWSHEGRMANAREVNAYRSEAARKTEIERQAEGREKTGVILEGVTATNPATGKEIPIWIADYVLAGYGTGAIMAVPAHDERDFEFAKKHGLEVKQVAMPVYVDEKNPPRSDKRDAQRQNIESSFTGEGLAINSGFLDGLPTAEAKEKMIAWLEQEKKGKRTVNFKLRDWVFSRQRYWGEPIPIIICDECGYVPVPEDQLPVLLPEVESYEPSETGESPLAKMREWVEVRCPNCGQDAERETDTMPNWAGSSWYFLRYCDPHNKRAFADPGKLRFWMPVDLYNGGMEHTTLHLLYSRFWHKFLWDIGVLPADIGPEPYACRRSHGLILAEGGEKMSKSKGNVVNPDGIVERYGADVFRVYEMFMGPFDQPVPWDTNGIEGVRRFLDRVWKICVGGTFDRPAATTVELSAVTSDLETLYHQSVKKVSEDIESLNFNTAVSQLMILTNAFHDAGGLPNEYREGYLKLLAPLAPHMTEELWRRLSHTTSIHLAEWPFYDPDKARSKTFELVVQVNGKVRDRLQVPADISEEEAKALALGSANVQKHLHGQAPVKIIYVQGRLVSMAT